MFLSIHTDNCFVQKPLQSISQKRPKNQPQKVSLQMEMSSQRRPLVSLLRLSIEHLPSQPPKYTLDREPRNKDFHANVCLIFNTNTKCFKNPSPLQNQSMMT